jgi:hypothetical protein
MSLADLWCDHATFHALDEPHRPMEECPDCGFVLRTITDQQGLIDAAAEERADGRAYELALLEDREEMR